LNTAVCNEGLCPGNPPPVGMRTSESVPFNAAVIASFCFPRNSSKPVSHGPFRSDIRIIHWLICRMHQQVSQLNMTIGSPSSLRDVCRRVSKYEESIWGPLCNLYWKWHREIARSPEHYFLVHNTSYDKYHRCRAKSRCIVITMNIICCRIHFLLHWGWEGRNRSCKKCMKCSTVTSASMKRLAHTRLYLLAVLDSIPRCRKLWFLVDFGNSPLWSRIPPKGERKPAPGRGGVNLKFAIQFYIVRPLG